MTRPVEPWGGGTGRIRLSLLALESLLSVLEVGLYRLPSHEHDDRGDQC